MVSFEKFILVFSKALKCHVPSPGALEKRGVGALELVAMDMKTRYGVSFQVFYTLYLHGSAHQMAYVLPFILIFLQTSTFDSVYY